MNLKKIIKGAGKVLAGLAVLTLLGSQVFSATQKTTAIGPMFNIRDGDKELFRGLNFTKDETVYTDPVTAGDQEKVVATIYYHNGVEDTFATNTMIKVGMPTDVSSAEKLLTASIKADNTSEITDTIVDGKIIGKSGLTIDTPSADSTLAFVPGSVRWFPNKSVTPVALPGGQSGDSIVSASGLNIGDIQGCWDYSGSITFALKINTPHLNPNLKLDKAVRNLAINEAFNKSDQAFAGDNLEYRINVSNDGQKEATSVLLKDALPSQISFTAGSLKYFPDGSSVAQTLPAGQSPEAIFGSGINLGNLVVGQNHRVEVTFQAKVNQTGTNAGQQLVNKANATSGPLSAADQVVTVIKVVPAEVKNPNFIFSKSAFNITQNKDAQSVEANPGDQIRYTLKTKNIGSGNGSIDVKDGIADVLEFANITDNGGGQSINQPNNSDEDSRIIIDFGSKGIATNQEDVENFTVKIMSPLPKNPPSGHHFDLVMFNVYGNQVIIKIKPPVATVINLSLTKNVRDVTTNEVNFTKSDKAFAGDVLEYQLVITNSGNGSSNSVKILDTLPANVAYLSGTTVISHDGASNTASDGIADQNGLAISQIQSGDTFIIFLRAKIDSGALVNSELINTATAISGGKNLTDQAQTLVQPVPSIITVSAPPVTQLPRTGASSYIAGIMSALFALTNYIYFSGRKKIKMLAFSNS